MKYIDAEKLYKKVDEQMGKFAELEKETEPDDMDLSIFYQGKRKMCSEVIGLIASLQQEKPEVDLEKEFEKYMSSKDESGFVLNRAGFTNPQTAYRLARYFYELGLNARKEE